MIWKLRSGGAFFCLELDKKTREQAAAGGSLKFTLPVFLSFSPSKYWRIRRFHHRIRKNILIIICIFLLNKLYYPDILKKSVFGGAIYHEKNSDCFFIRHFGNALLCGCAVPAWNDRPEARHGNFPEKQTDSGSLPKIDSTGSLPGARL